MSQHTAQKSRYAAAKGRSKRRRLTSPMSRLTGHRCRRSDVHTRRRSQGNPGQESSYRMPRAVPLAEGQWQKSGRRAAAARPRARCFSQNKVIGLYAGIPAPRIRPHGDDIPVRLREGGFSILAEPTLAPLRPLRHVFQGWWMCAGARAWPRAKPRGRFISGSHCALFSSADSPWNEISMLNLWTRREAAAASKQASKHTYESASERTPSTHVL